MFSPLYLGTNHMLGIDNYVPLTTNNFEIRIYNMDGTAPTEYSDVLTLSTDSIGEISESQNDIPVHYGNGVIKFPSKVDYGTVNWTLNCYCEPGVLDALRAWRNQVYNSQTERMGLPTEYMKNVYFIKYDGQGGVRDVIKCPGTWISSLNNGAMNQQGGSLVQVQVSLVISKAIYLTKEQITAGYLV